MATTLSAPAWRAASTTHTIIGRPATSWRTLALSLFTRVPRPAALPRTSGDSRLMALDVTRSAHRSAAAPRAYGSLEMPLTRTGFAGANGFAYGRDLMRLAVLTSLAVALLAAPAYAHQTSVKPVELHVDGATARLS